MPLLKNPTPRNISLLAASFASVVPALVMVFSGILWLWGLMAFILGFVAAYLVFYALLEYFIYRKIKVIYKNIHQVKTSELSGDQDPIAEVSKDVFAWAKEQRNEIQTLKRQENFRREFLSNVSHELKTPIFNIQGYIHTLLDGALQDKSVNKKFLAKAARSTERLSELVEDLSTITNIESGQLEMEPAPFNIKKLAEEVFDAMELRARERDITMGFKEGGDGSFTVIADRSRIKQVLVNLVSNGIKYGNKEGRILVGFYDMDRNILIEVSDNGDGIEPEHLPRLFERFYRVDKSRSREAGGSGLGLAIVKHIIEAHNQTINVRSTLGKGTTFGFTLQKGKD